MALPGVTYNPLQSNVFSYGQSGPGHNFLTYPPLTQLGSAYTNANAPTPPPALSSPLTAPVGPAAPTGFQGDGGGNAPGNYGEFNQGAYQQDYDSSSMDSLTDPIGEAYDKFTDAITPSFLQDWEMPAFMDPVIAGVTGGIPGLVGYGANQMFDSMFGVTEEEQAYFDNIEDKYADQLAGVGSWTNPDTGITEHFTGTNALFSNQLNPETGEMEMGINPNVTENNYNELGQFVDPFTGKVAANNTQEAWDSLTTEQQMAIAIERNTDDDYFNNISQKNMDVLNAKMSRLAPTLPTLPAAPRAKPKPVAPIFAKQKAKVAPAPVPPPVPEAAPAPAPAPNDVIGGKLGFGYGVVDKSLGAELATMDNENEDMTMSQAAQAKASHSFDTQGASLAGYSYGAPDNAGPDVADVDWSGVDSAAGAAAASDGADADAGGPACFITTAVVGHIGEADDGPTLTALRAFRDDFMKDDPLVAEYYEIAPGIVEKLNEIPHNDIIYKRLNTAYIQPAIRAIQEDKMELAKELYVEMVRYAQGMTK